MTKRKQTSETSPQKKQRNGLIWFDPTCLPPRNKKSIDKLSENIINYNKSVGLTTKSNLSIAKVISDLQSICVKEFGECKICRFGSSVNGFGTIYSDIDCFVNIVDSKAGKQLRRLKKALDYSSTFFVNNIVYRARVPIITIKHLRSQTACDVSFKTEGNDRTDVEDNSTLLKAYADLNDKIPAVGRYIKVVLKNSQFGSASCGGLSSYSHIIMFIYYLIQSKTIPHIPVNDKIKYHKPVNVNKTHGAMFLDFLAFYSCGFDSSSHKIDIRYANTLNCHKSTIFHIEDPIIDRNLGKCMSAGRTHDMKVFYFKVYHVLSSQTMSTAELERWVGAPDNQKKFFPSDYYPKLHPNCNISITEDDNNNSRPSSSQSPPIPVQPTKKQPNKKEKYVPPPIGRSSHEASVKMIKDSLAAMMLADQKGLTKSQQNTHPLNNGHAQSPAQQNQNWRGNSLRHKAPEPAWTKNDYKPSERENISKTVMNQRNSHLIGVQIAIGAQQRAQTRPKPECPVKEHKTIQHTPGPMQPRPKHTFHSKDPKTNQQISAQKQSKPKPVQPKSILKELKATDKTPALTKPSSVTKENKPTEQTQPRPKPVAPSKDHLKEVSVKAKGKEKLMNNITENHSEPHWGSMSSSTDGRWGSICSDVDDIWHSAAQEISGIVKNDVLLKNKTKMTPSQDQDKLDQTCYNTNLSWPIDWKVADYYCTGGDIKPLVVIPALAALGVKVPSLLEPNSVVLNKLDCISGFQSKLYVGQIHDVLETVGCVIGTCQTIRSTLDCNIVDQTDKNIIEEVLSVKQAESLGALMIDVKCQNTTTNGLVKKANKLAQTFCDASNECNILATAQTTNYECPLSNVIGNSLEVLEALTCLSGKASNDIENLVCMQGGHILVMLQICETPKKAAAMIREVLNNDYAHEKFCQMVQAQGVSELNTNKLRLKQYSDVIPQAPHIEWLSLKQGDGVIQNINYDVINKLATSMGCCHERGSCDLDHRAGIRLKVRVGEIVTKNQVWAEIHHSGQLTNKLKQDIISNGIVVKQISVSRVISTFRSYNKRDRHNSQRSVEKVANQNKANVRQVKLAEAPIDTPPTSDIPTTKALPNQPSINTKGPLQPERVEFTIQCEGQTDLVTPSNDTVTQEYVIVEELVTQEITEVPLAAGETSIVPGGITSARKKRKNRKKRNTSSRSSPNSQSENIEVQDIKNMIEQASTDLPDVSQASTDLPDVGQNRIEVTTTVT